MKRLTADVASMEWAKDHTFTPPPRAWIGERIKKLNKLLGEGSEKSALALTGPITLTPKKSEVGRAYFQASCTFDALDLLACEGSNLSQ